MFFHVTHKQYSRMSRKLQMDTNKKLRTRGLAILACILAESIRRRYCQHLDRDMPDAPVDESKSDSDEPKTDHRSCNEP